MRKLLQRCGILRTPDIQSATYEFAVFLMSEGTAQGLPRPLEVKKFTKTFTWDAGARYFYDGELLANDIVARIVKHGLDTDMANGKAVRYTPHTVYKIMKEEVQND